MSSKFDIHKFYCIAIIFQVAIKLLIFLAQQITTKTALRYFKKLEPGAKIIVKLI